MRDVEEQLQTLRRGVDQIDPEPEFLEKLRRSVREGRPLRVKYGIDPTGISVHLGHTVPLRKLRQFQDLGHTAVVIIGDYTALVGDPSGRDETRARLTEQQVAENARDYLAQVGRIIDLSKAEVHHNGDWFSRWSFLQVLDLTRQMTLSQISARDDFAKRLAAEKPVYLHECLYPLMQGWDSVEVRADVELGGTEQLFSLLVARDLQKAQGQSPQVAMTLPILVGTDGVRRMGKSLGNYIGVADDPNTMFGKVMSIPDEPMRQYFTLLTDIPMTEVDRWLGPDVNPRDAKEALGKAIVTQYWGADKAEEATVEFRRRSKGLDPENIQTSLVSTFSFGEEMVVDFALCRVRSLPQLIVDDLKLDKSTSNARRMIEQGGVTIGPSRYCVKSPKAVLYIDSAKQEHRIKLVDDEISKDFEEKDFILRYGRRNIRYVKFKKFYEK
jgi:tyrosyl-tRNA synthetase